MIVVDTNIIAYLYLSGEHSTKVEKLLSVDPLWTAPLLWRSEFRNVLCQYLRQNRLTLDDTSLIIQQAELLMQDSEYHVSSSHIMQLVNSSNCSAYDCEFVALAQYLDIPLITSDKKILREFPAISKSLDTYLE